MKIEPLRGGLALPAASIAVHMPGGAFIEPSRLWLFTGTISDAQLSKMARGELSESLAAKRVPGAAWAVPGGAVLVPSRFLEAGARYTLITPELGRLAEFAVTSSAQAAPLTRVWPPEQQPGALFAVYCGARLPASALDVTFQPGDVALRFSPDFGLLPDGRQCGTLTSLVGEVSLPFLVPRASDEEFSFEPAPLVLGAASAPEPATCLADEQPFGPGCLLVDDDRALLRAGPEPQLFSVLAGGVAELALLAPNGEFQVRSLAPDSEQLITAAAVSPTGVLVSWQVNVRTRPSRPHVVLNEVLANAAGAEPASEWVELVNDGAQPATLMGFTLSDGASPVTLPDAELQPGEFALLVGPEFPLSNGVDVAPAPGTQLIVLPRLGTNGLSNSGEALTLRDASGALVSSFPARAARRGGVSIARRAPGSPDSDAAAFAEHGAPGASPGAVNSFEP